MRGIKFRAFNLETKTMIYLDPLQWPLKALEDEENWKVMQFTGLKDREGKEIFESDILKVKWSIKNDSPDSEWKTEEHISGVEWCNSGWVIQWSYFRKPFEIDGNKELCWYEDYHRSDERGSFQKLTDFEILGNIYENPELLQKEHHV